jgi:hypothetical protein
METTVIPDDYLTASDAALSRADAVSDADKGAAFWIGEAQVKAIQAAAAAIDRLAEAVEALRPD